MPLPGTHCAETNGGRHVRVRGNSIHCLATRHLIGTSVSIAARTGIKSCIRTGIAIVAGHSAGHKVGGCTRRVQACDDTTSHGTEWAARRRARCLTRHGRINELGLRTGSFFADYNAARGRQGLARGAGSAEKVAIVAQDGRVRKDGLLTVSIGTSRQFGTAAIGRFVHCHIGANGIPPRLARLSHEACRTKFQGRRRRAARRNATVRTSNSIAARTMQKYSIGTGVIVAVDRRRDKVHVSARATRTGHC
jgi:hypothetical protein